MYTYKNDIALIKLKETFDIDPTISKVILDDKINDEPRKGVFAGWGLHKPSDTEPETLHYLVYTTKTNYECNNFHLNLDKNQFCGQTEHGDGACNRDFGGPMTIENTSIQIGISSWVEGCGKNVPDVFTRVASYNLWIKDTIAKN